VSVPVLIVAFNRPAVTAQVFEAVRQARPARLYVAVDGPRASRPADAALCAEVRRIVSAVDWPCELRTLFREENLGCKRGVSSAIDWFFAGEEHGIILEDDCLPSASFFRFCEVLLPQFRDDPRVFSIQGNFFGADGAPQASYLFSRLFYMWGWASWADRWRAVDVSQVDAAGTGEALDAGWVGRSFLLRHYWREIVRRQAAGAIDSWGYPVMFHCFRHRLVNVTPTRNLVLNIGDGPSATRTTSLDCGPFHQRALDIAFPLSGAPRHEGGEALLRWEHRWRIQVTRWKLLKHWLRSLLGGRR
jgi:hypothetical protein